MTGLLRAEVRRLASRRLFRVLAGLAVFGILLAGILVFLDSDRDVEAVQIDARRAVEECRRFERERSVAPGEPPLSVRESFCIDMAEQFAELDPRFDVVARVPDAVRGVAVPLALAAFVLGASAVGAEWGHGTLATLLTWEPRRLRVLGAKAAAAVVMVAVATVVLLILLTLALWPAGAFRGIADGMTWGWWRMVAAIWLRGAALAAFSAAAATALATLIRNSAGAIAVGFAYAGMADPLLALWRQGRLQPWLLQRNVPQLLGFPVLVQTGAPGPEGFTRELTRQVVTSPWRPGGLFAVYAVVLLLIAYASLRARDVT